MDPKCTMIDEIKQIIKNRITSLFLKSILSTKNTTRKTQCFLPQIEARMEHICDVTRLNMLDLFLYFACVPKQWTAAYIFFVVTDLFSTSPLVIARCVHRFTLTQTPSANNAIVYVLLHMRWNVAGGFIQYIYTHILYTQLHEKDHSNGFIVLCFLCLKPIHSFHLSVLFIHKCTV